MFFTIPVTFAIDPDEWNEEYDHGSASAALKDIIRVLTDATEDGALRDLIVEQWPMMRDNAVTTTGRVLVGVGPHNLPPDAISGCPVVSFTRVGRAEGMLPDRGVAITRDGAKYNVHSCAWDTEAGRWSSENGAYGVAYQRAHEIAQERIHRDATP